MFFAINSLNNQILDYLEDLGDIVDATRYFHSKEYGKKSEFERNVVDNKLNIFCTAFLRRKLV